MVLNKIPKVGCVVLGVIVLVLIAMTMMLKPRISNLMFDDLKQKGYNVSYKHAHVTLLKHFPNVETKIESLLVTKGAGGDSVFFVNSASAKLSLPKILKNELEFKTIDLDCPRLNYCAETMPSELNKEVKSAETKTENQEDLMFFDLVKVSKLSVTEGEFFYQLMDSSFICFSGVNYSMSGQINADLIDLKMKLEVQNVNSDIATIGVRNRSLDLVSDLSYDIEKEILIIDSTLMYLDNANIITKGFIDTNSRFFDLDLKADDVNVKDMLSLFYSGINKAQYDAIGEVDLVGYVQGKYKGKDQWPAFGLDLEMSDASLQFVDKANKIDKINIEAKVRHPEGSPLDSIIIEVDELKLVSGDNYVSSQILFATPFSDLNLSGNFDMKLDLATLKNTIPMATNEIVGNVDARVDFDGKLSDIEQENYAAFSTSGFMTLRQYYIKNATIPQGLKIAQASLDFTPDRINIKNFAGYLGASDLRLSGYLSNYFTYLFDDKDLKGVLTLSSNFIDLNEFATRYNAPNTAQVSVNKSGAEVFLLPKRLDLVLNAAISKVIIDDVHLSQCRGQLTLNSSSLGLDRFMFNALGGSVRVDGEYNTINKNAIFSNIKLNAQNLDIKQTVNSVGVLREILPPNQKTEGSLSSEMSYYAQLNSDGVLNMSSIKSSGYIKSPGIRIANNSGLNKLAVQLKDERYRDFTTSPLTINYTMDKGQLNLSPFDVKIVDKNINAQGWYNLNNTLNFRLNTTVKAKELGADVSKYVAMISDPNKSLPVGIIIHGDAKDPQIKYDTRDAIKALRDDVSKKLNGDAVKSILKGFF